MNHSLDPYRLVARLTGTARVAFLLLNILLLQGSLFATPIQAQQTRHADPASDLQNLPRDGGLLTWQGDAQIIGYRNIEHLSPTREVLAGGQVLTLPEALQDFTGLRYSVAGAQFDIEGYLTHNHVAGLLIIKDGRILLERYGFGNTEDSVWVSFSMTKSVVSMLTGAAVADGFIGSVDDKVTDYLPQLKNSSYDQVTIRNVLQMASGVEWNEDYADPRSDVASSPNDLMSLFHFLGTKPRVAPPGERFNYNTGETNLAGAILRAAIGNNLATYLAHKIWTPFGMEADANWVTHGAGNGELGGCCISATLRDFGRLGLFAMNGGVLADGSRVLPENWMRDSVTPSQSNEGYGYLWWLQGNGIFRASGIFGQGIYINPATNLVIVTQGAWTTATGAEYAAHRDAFFAAVDAAL